MLGIEKPLECWTKSSSRQVHKLPRRSTSPPRLFSIQYSKRKPTHPCYIRYYNNQMLHLVREDKDEENIHFKQTQNFSSIIFQVQVGSISYLHYLNQSLVFPSKCNVLIRHQVPVDSDCRNIWFILICIHLLNRFIENLQILRGLRC